MQTFILVHFLSLNLPFLAPIFKICICVILETPLSNNISSQNLS